MILLPHPGRRLHHGEDFWDETAFCYAPPEFIRSNILGAHPNWHDCRAELLEARADECVPREAQPDAVALQAVVEAREDGNATGA